MRKIFFAFAALLLILVFSGCTSYSKTSVSTNEPQDENNETIRTEVPTEPAAPKPVKVFADETIIVKINNTSSINTSSLERKIHTGINVERFKLGLSTLGWNQQLSYIARKHSRDMAARDYFEHESPDGKTFQDRYNESGFECTIVISTTGDVQETALGGENLYLTHTEQRDWYQEKNGVRTYVRSDYYTEGEIADATVQGWMNSTKHRENIERPYWQTEGIGVVIADDNTIYVTQNFC